MPVGPQDAAVGVTDDDDVACVVEEVAEHARRSDLVARESGCSRQRSRVVLLVEQGRAGLAGVHPGLAAAIPRVGDHIANELEDAASVHRRLHGHAGAAPAHFRASTPACRPTQVSRSDLVAPIGKPTLPRPAPGSLQRCCNDRRKFAAVVRTTFSRYRPPWSGPAERLGVVQTNPTCQPPAERGAQRWRSPTRRRARKRFTVRDPPDADRRRVGRCRVGQHLRDLQPGHRRGARRMSPPGRPRTSTARCGPRGARSNGSWSRITPSERGRMIWRLGDLILEHAEEFAAARVAGQRQAARRRPRRRRRARRRHVPLHGGLGDEDRGQHDPDLGALHAGREFHAYTLREPVGVVGQIIPWNFPLLMAAWKLGAGAGRGLHGRAQAGRADAAVGAAPRRADARGRAPGGRRQHRHRLRRDAGAALAATTTSTRSRSPARPRSAR